eukprot:gene38009-46906_t
MTLASPDTIEQAKQFVSATFPLTDIVDEHSTMINFEIPKSNIEKLSAAFRLLESKKAELGIVDYAMIERKSVLDFSPIQASLVPKMYM